MATPLATPTDLDRRTARLLGRTTVHHQPWHPAIVWDLDGDTYRAIRGILPDHDRPVFLGRVRATVRSAQAAIRLERQIHEIWASQIQILAGGVPTGIPGNLGMILHTIYEVLKIEHGVGAITASDLSRLCEHNRAGCSMARRMPTCLRFYRDGREVPHPGFQVPPDVRQRWESVAVPGVTLAPHARTWVPVRDARCEHDRERNRAILAICEGIASMVRGPAPVDPENIDATLIQAAFDATAPGGGKTLAPGGGKGLAVDGTLSAAGLIMILEAIRPVRDDRTVAGLLASRGD